jgi:hypothetical protein
MSVKITIGSEVINFPTSGTDANWAEAVSDFAVAVEGQLQTVSTQGDVAPQVKDIGEIDTVELFTVSTAQIRSFVCQYSTYRTSDTESKTTVGTVYGVYNETDQSWILEHEFSGDKQTPSGAPYITFAMNQNALEASSVTIGGVYDDGKISFSAKVLPVSN